ncbi:MAG: phenylacetic acid degradation protein [Bacteroidetes bacterium]|nr:MAG: phenylacetic acid degradation protein [Bacteroidota bacterium]
MSKFQPLRVTEIRRETPDSVSLLLEPVSGEVFSFVAGQYLTLRTTIDGEDIRRSYSLCSNPQGEGLRVAIKEVNGGKFSTFANRELKVGETLDSMPPEGRFVVDTRPNTKNHLAFAAGSGITPILSIIKDVLTTNNSSTFTLFYVNKDTASIMFKDELADLKDTYLERLQIFNLLTREPVEIELFGGRLDSSRLSSIFKSVVNPSNFDVAYLCGPEEMIMDCKSSLVTNGLSEPNIKFELFTTSAPASTSTSASTESKTTNSATSGDKVDIAIVLDGVTTTVSVKRTGKSILDAALDAGLDAPFSCQGGVCCTCRCKMTSGEASMDINFALEEDEVENGYVLACQSHPVGDGPFVMDFDQP